MRSQSLNSRLYSHLSRLSLFVVAVILISICRLLLLTSTSYEDILNLDGSSNDHNPIAVSSSVNFEQQNTNETNISSIVIGGISLQRTKCMTDVLETLPRYASEFCKNVSNNCFNLSCLNVLTGNNMPSVSSMSTKDTTIPDASYINMTKNCDVFKKERGFHINSLTKDSVSFPIAFNILVHKTASQFELLLRSLYRPQNVFCVHVDVKSSKEFQDAVRHIAGCFENVHMASRMESVTWAGFSRLQADITCMRDHLARGNDWKYLINTAGQAFPIRTNEEMVQILKIYNGSNDIEGIYGNRLLKGRYQNEWLEDQLKNIVIQTGRKNPSPPHDIDIVRGSAYGIFSRKFVDFIINDRKAVSLLEWSKKTWSPDELYWATLHHTYSNPHLHTPGGFSGYPSDKKWMAVYANWGDAGCSGKYVRGVCVNGIADIPRLIARKEFFVNKFYQDFQPLALSCLSSWIRFKEQCGAPFDERFYRNLEFINWPR